MEQSAETIKKGNEIAEEGNRLVSEDRKVVEAMIDSINEAVDAAVQLSSSSQQQLAGMEQIVPAMENINQASEQNVAGSKQTQEAIEELNVMAKEFRIRNGEVQIIRGMNKSDEEFYKELLNDFKEEGVEHLQTIVNGLLDIEKKGKSEDQELLETIFRETHSLKGAARAVDLKTIENLCMAMESVMQKVKDGKLGFSPGFFDVFFEGTDLLEVLISEITGSKQTITENRISKVVNNLKAIEKGVSPAGGKKKTQTTSSAASPKKHPAKEDKQPEPEPPKTEEKPVAEDRKTMKNPLKIRIREM
ncbi:MAG: Hpt domain-containing protein [Bacteroidales bacterium]|nr:Hpt domain-containing protein [Bacteroidales bacterium]